MAEKVKNFSFDERPIVTYPWTEWEDGGVWRILQGADFTVPLKSMQAQLYMRAKATSRRVRTRFEHDPPGIVFQFVNDRPAPAPAKKAPAKKASATKKATRRA